MATTDFVAARLKYPLFDPSSADRPLGIQRRRLRWLERITMTMRELDRLKVIQDVADRKKVMLIP
ncbi:hypothetical protein [Burkholderia cepacia]|uniref:hypothetical protein n=1 Tax=Burkholderia cepacia TaxID=292 RepID=UPI00158C411F|nr:hypothetical protein [Burkholderia cepacia]